EVAAAQGEAGVERALLGDVAEVGAAVTGGAAVHQHLAGVGPDLAEQYLEQGGLAGAVGAEDGDELAGLDLQVEVLDERAAAARDPHPALRDDGPGAGATTVVTGHRLSVPHRRRAGHRPAPR